MYTRITPSKNGREAIEYARGNDKGHNGNETRNLLVGSVNMLPDDTMSYEEQMQVFWDKASTRHTVQVRRIVGSFSEKELDPNDPNSPHKALQMASEFVTEYYPDRQAAIFIQNDGVGGKLHFHAIVNDCDMTSAKGCSIHQQKAWYVEKNFDELAKSYIELDAGEPAKDKVTQAERRKRQENQKAIEAGEPEKVKYLWRDDMKSRIREAMKEATDREDFLKRLTARGVEGEYRSSKKHGDYIIYELVDLSGFKGELPKKNEYFRSKSFKMGDDYELEELDRQIAKKKVTTFTPEPAFTVNRQKTADELRREQEETAKMQEETNKFYDWCEKNGIDAVKFADDDAYYDKARKRYDAWVQNPSPESQIAPTSHRRPVNNRKAPEKHTEPVEPTPAPVQAKDKAAEQMRQKNAEVLQMLIEEGNRLSDEEKAAIRESEEIIKHNNFM